MEVRKISADQDQKATSYCCPGFKLLSWLLQCFGHIQSKNKNTNSVVFFFFKSKSAIGFSPVIWLRHGKSFKLELCQQYTDSSKVSSWTVKSGQSDSKLSCLKLDKI